MVMVAARFMKTTLEVNSPSDILPEQISRLDFLVRKMAATVLQNKLCLEGFRIEGNIGDERWSNWARWAHAADIRAPDPRVVLV